MILNEPYLPTISLEDILAYQPGDEQTYTGSRLVNAVANILFFDSTREPNVIADRLQLDKRHLSYAIKMETGMTLKELIIKYRLTKLQEFISQHPATPVKEVARIFGFSTPHALWRFFQTYTGETPDGRKSESPRVDNYHKMVKDIREGRYIPRWKLAKQKDIE